MGAQVVAAELLHAGQGGEGVEVVDRQVEGGAGKGEIQVLIEALTGLESIPFDEILLPDTGVVVDAE